MINVENFLKINSEQVFIDLDFLVDKHHRFLDLRRERIERVLAAHYTGQMIFVKSHDGVNLFLSGALAWIETIQKAFDLPNSKVVFNTISDVPGYQWVPMVLKAFIDAHTIQQSNINRDLANAKFAGALCTGRWNVYRLSTIFELDKAFPGDTFITHRSKLTQQTLSIFPPGEFDDEIKWAEQKQFNVDAGIPDDHPPGYLSYKDGFAAYPALWHQYHIEVVMETDEYQNYWFTDKVGKCLATGKPFVMLSGQHSLKNLKALGFKTFDQYIDESYDNCVLPHQRICAMIKSLKVLYQDPNKQNILIEMQQTANKNHEIFQHYVQSKI